MVVGIDSGKMLRGGLSGTKTVQEINIMTIITVVDGLRWGRHTQCLIWKVRIGTGCQVLAAKFWLSFLGATACRNVGVSSRTSGCRSAGSYFCG